MTPDQTCNHAYERLAKGVAGLHPGAIIDNGPTPTFGEVKAAAEARMHPDRKHWFRDEFTGFDEPIRRKLPYDNSSTGTTMRRHSASGFSVTYNKTTIAAESDVISLDLSGFGSGSANCIWMDDLYYADWFDYQRTAWTKAREIDARLLTNDELLTLKILVEATTSALHGSTRCTPIIRCTVDQCYSLVAHYGTPGRFGYLTPDFKTMGELDDNRTEYFRRQAPPELVLGGRRILEMADDALDFVPQAILDDYRRRRAAATAFDASKKMIRVPSDDHDIPDSWEEE